jgi:hypothetical protein
MASPYICDSTIVIKMRDKDIDFWRAAVYKQGKM